MQTIDAGDGLELVVVSKVDAALEAHANEAAQVYFGRGGVQLTKGDTVLDVGANVGSFARVAALQVGAAGRVVAVEPLPQIHAALVENARRFAAWAQRRQLDAAAIEPLLAGAGDGRTPGKPYTFYPHCSAISTSVPDVEDVLAATFSLARHSQRPTSRLQWAAGMLAAWLPGLYRLLHRWLFPLLFLKGASRVWCEQRTVAEVMEQLGIRELALLKVNVERAEMEVLEGVSKDTWPRVRQVSLQVHDIAGRVQQVVQLLRDVAGFSTVEVWKEPRFQDCCLYMVYATRTHGGGHHAST